MKRVVAGLALALAVGAFAAHPQTLNKEGFVGVNKTQSGQSLGHSKLAFFALFVCAFLQLQTTGSCVFSNDFWLFLYILCCMDAICAYSSVIRPTSSDIEESIENRRNICF